MHNNERLTTNQNTFNIAQSPASDEKFSNQEE